MVATLEGGVGVERKGWIGIYLEAQKQYVRKLHGRNRKEANEIFFKKKKKRT